MSTRHHLLVLATLVIGLCVIHGAFVFEPGRLTDEGFYEPAIERALAGGSPYEVPGFLYPPTFARAGTALVRAFGMEMSRYILRALNLVGLIYVLWFTVVRGIGEAHAGQAAPDAEQPWLLVGLPLTLLWTPGVGFGIYVGNLSFLVGAVALFAIWTADQRPARAAILLAATLLTKPLVAGALPLFLLPAPRTGAASRLLQRLQPRRVASALLAGLLAIAILWVDRHELVPMLGAEPSDLAKKRSLSIFRIARELGFGELRLPLFGVVVAALCVGFWGRLRGRRHLLVAAQLAVPLTTLVVWSHTLVLFFPVAAMAIGRWIARRRAAGIAGILGGEPEERLEAVIVLGSTLVLVFAHPGGFADKPGIVQAMLLSPPLLALIALATYWFRTQPNAQPDGVESRRC